MSLNQSQFWNKSDRDLKGGKSVIQTSSEQANEVECDIYFKCALEVHRHKIKISNWKIFF